MCSSVSDRCPKIPAGAREQVFGTVSRRAASPCKWNVFRLAASRRCQYCLLSLNFPRYSENVEFHHALISQLSKSRTHELSSLEQPPFSGKGNPQPGRLSPHRVIVLGNPGEQIFVLTWSSSGNVNSFPVKVKLQRFFKQKQTNTGPLILTNVRTKPPVTWSAGDTSENDSLTRLILPIVYARCTACDMMV